MIRVVLAGVTGQVGRALLPAIAASGDLQLVGAVSRSGAGRDAGEAVSVAPLGVTIVATLSEALGVPSDVVVDYTTPDVVGRNVLEAIAAGRHVVVGTSGLGADEYAAIDQAARQKGVGVLAAGNFSITATLLKRFALEAARYVPDVEIIDYASATKPDTPSGTGRELAEARCNVEAGRSAGRRPRNARRGRRRRSKRWSARACPAHAVLRALGGSGVRCRQRTPGHPPRRRQLCRAIRRRHAARDPPRRRAAGIAPRS